TPPVKAEAPSLEPEPPDEEFGATFAAQLVEESLEEKPMEFSSFEEVGAEEPPPEIPPEIPLEEPIQEFSGGDGEPLEDFSANEPEPQNESFEAAPLEPDQPLEVPNPPQSQNGEMDISSMATAMDQEGVSEGLLYDLEISGID